MRNCCTPSVTSERAAKASDRWFPTFNLDFIACFLEALREFSFRSRLRSWTPTTTSLLRWYFQGVTELTARTGTVASLSNHGSANSSWLFQFLAGWVVLGKDTLIL